MFENLEPKNLQMYARSVYDNPQCMTEEEFLEDYKRFKYIKKLCRRYLTEVATAKRSAESVDDVQFSERLMLNHLILLTNVFGVVPTVRILFAKCEGDEKLMRVLKPFLWHAKYLSEIVKGINGKIIFTDRIPLDEALL